MSSISINYKNHICGFQVQCGLAHCNDRIPSNCAFYTTEASCKQREAWTANTVYNCSCQFGNPYEGLDITFPIYGINDTKDTSPYVWFCGGENPSRGNPWTVLGIIFFTFLGIIVCILVILPSIYAICAKMHYRKSTKKSEKRSMKKKNKHNKVIQNSQLGIDDQSIYENTSQQNLDYLNIEQLNSTMTSSLIGLDSKQVNKRLKKKKKQQ